MHRLVVALVTLIGLTGAAFLAGYLFLFSDSTDRASALVPAQTTVYLNVYLQPSTGQQMNLGGLIGRLPGFADEASLDQKVDQVVENLIWTTGFGLDYQDQIKPWLGNQVAVAGWPATGDSTPIAVLIAEVKDRAAAESALAELPTDGGFSFTERSYEGVQLHVAEGGAYAFVGEMLVFAESAAAIEAVVDVDGGAEALSSREDFRTTMADLPADHLASTFVDLAALADATGTGEQLSAFSTAGAALVAELDGLRISGSAPFDRNGAASSSEAGFGLGGEPSSLVDWMPEETIAEVVIFGLRQALEDAEAAAASVPEGAEITGALDTLRALAAFGFGIDIDADLLPLLDREVGLAIAGLENGLPMGQILLRPEDPEAAEAALERIVERLVATGASERTEAGAGADITVISIPAAAEVAYAVRDGIIIISLGAEQVASALQAHADGETIAGSDRYMQTFEVAGERAGNEVFIDIGAVMELLGPTLGLPDDTRDILGQIGSFGFTAPSRADQVEFHAVLTVEEP
ncbi:MAG: DUF3352 domain-containing protein [Chloroflexota bacterium]|nr:DUF3352 domain-containing protein [Chloroflexota bacterium]